MKMKWEMGNVQRAKKESERKETCHRSWPFSWGGPFPDFPFLVNSYFTLSTQLSVTIFSFLELHKYGYTLHLSLVNTLGQGEN